jgi:ribosomal protein L14E/L6E/L27E
MKEPLSFERGRVAESTQGRDKGRSFIVLERMDPDYVLMADGQTHRLNAPKKKKIKHLHARPVMIDLNTIRPEGGPLQDSDLRRALQQNGFDVKHPLCKED